MFKKTLLVIAPNRHRFQYFVEMIDGSQWADIVMITSAHEMFGRSPLSSFVVLLNEYNSHPDWSAIEVEIRKMKETK